MALPPVAQRAPATMTPAVRWAWLLSLAVATGAALVLAFVLSFADVGGFYERHFVWLFWVNAAVAALLVLVLGLVAVRLVVRLRRGKFGSRLLIKLAGILAVVGLLPGLVIYAVSYQFATRSIDNWFDVKVAGALDAGLNLGRATLDALSNELLRRARDGAERLQASGQVLSPLQLERARALMGVHEASVVGATGAAEAVARAETATWPNALPTERAPSTMLRQARQTGWSTAVEGLEDDAPATRSGGYARLRVVVRLADSHIALLAPRERYLMVVQALPRSLAQHALAVQGAYSEYQQRALARDSLRRMYIGALTLALMLAVFAAVLLAIVLGNQLARPLLLLADGVREVAAGDYTQKPVFASNDELGGLTRSFADMTNQVSEARQQVQRGMAQLDAARGRLQTILDTLSAGVVVFDGDNRIDTVNPGATRILQRPLSAYRGQRLEEVPGLEAFAQAVSQRFDQLAHNAEMGERDPWQDHFDLPRGDGGTLSLLVRGATLGSALTSGVGDARQAPRPGQPRLVVFDDITEVVSAQRSAAWAEVARRLAHEIKNPLTPIQLSAQRLEMRLANKLDSSDQALLQRSVNTIVTQVSAMQKLVNEFRDYARLPAAQLSPLDLNAVVRDVMGLYGQALDSGRVQQHLEPDLPALWGDATQLRQVIHNLVQNALDAVADLPSGQVRLITRCLRGDDNRPREVLLQVEDDGPGFSERVLKRAFEPYVTTKSSGTGLGLAVVKKIADEHGARVRVSNRLAAQSTALGAAAPEGGSEPAPVPVVGARVSISFSKLVNEGNAPSAPAADTPPHPTALRLHSPQGRHGYDSGR